MTEPLFQQGSLEEAVGALRRDLLAENGPQISTMRNYRFAILPYPPRAWIALGSRAQAASRACTFAA